MGEETITQVQRMGLLGDAGGMMAYKAMDGKLTGVPGFTCARQRSGCNHQMNRVVAVPSGAFEMGE